MKHNVTQFKYPGKTTADSYHQHTRTGTILKSHEIVSLATRMKIFPAEQAGLTRTIIDESGGETSNKRHDF